MQQEHVGTKTSLTKKILWYTSGCAPSTQLLYVNKGLKKVSLKPYPDPFL